MNRTRHAELVDFLVAAGATVIAAAVWIGILAVLTGVLP